MSENTVNPLELTMVEKATVTSLVGAIKEVDMRSNKVFGTCKAFFNRNSTSKTKAIRTALTKAMNKVVETEESHIKARVTKVTSIAGDFIGYKMDAKDLYFNRIEEISTLMKFFEADEENTLVNTFQEVRDLINDVLGNEDGLSKKEFNELVTTLIASIKETNKIEDGEALVFKGTKEQLIAMIKAQFPDDLKSIAEELGK